MKHIRPLGIVIFFGLLWAFIYHLGGEKNILWVDDWGAVLTVLKHQNNAFEALQTEWFPLMTFRPLGGLIYPLLARIAIFSMPLVYFLNLVLFLSSIFLMGMALRKFFGPKFIFLFLVMASLPLGAAPIVYSPINLLPFNLSVLMLSAVFWFFFGRAWTATSWTFATLGIFACFLSYDAFFPILIAFMGLYFLATNGNFKKRLMAVSPVIAGVFIAVVYQKIIVSRIGGPNLSRLHLEVLKDPNAYKVAHDGVYHGIDKLARISYSSFLNTELFIQIFILILAAAGVFLYWQFPKSQSQEGLLSQRKLFVFGILGMLLTLPLPYWLSANDVNVVGYDSRIFGAVWLLFCAVIAALVDRFSKYKIPSTVFLLIIFVFLFAGMNQMSTEARQAAAERDQIAESYKSSADLEKCEAVVVLHKKSETSLFDIQSHICQWDTSGLMVTAVGQPQRTAISVGPEMLGNRLKEKDSNILFDGYLEMNFTKQKICSFDPTNKQVKPLQNMSEVEAFISH